MHIIVNGQGIELLYEKALYEPAERLLIIADVHLGKALHFRKEGIAFPAIAQKGDYDALKQLFEKVQPRQVFFLGDLFHSSINQDWLSFCDLIRAFNAIRFTLVKGNHDLISNARFSELCIKVVDHIDDGVFRYSHEPMKKIPDGRFNICGHIHPGIVLNGPGRQQLRLPCFYLSERTFILPAFGLLTGLHPMPRGKNIQVFGVLPGSVKRVI